MTEQGIAPTGRALWTEEEELEFYARLEREWVLTDVRPLMEGAALGVEPDEKHLPEAAVAYKILDTVLKVCELKKEQLRPHLLEWAKQYGAPTAKGGQEILFGENRVTRERRVNHQLEPEDLRALVEANGLKLSDVTTEVKVTKVDPSKIKGLIATGKLKAEAVEEVKKVHWTLQFEGSPFLDRLLLRVTGELGKELRDRMLRGREHRRAERAMRTQKEE